MGRRKRKNAGEVMDSTGSLPDDALLVIFSHISTRDLLSRMALVCKRWLRLVKSHSVKELLPSVLCRYDCPWGSLIEEVILCGLPRLLRNLKRIALPFVFDDVLVELGRFCPKLKELRFEGFSCTISKSTKKHPVTDRGVIAIAEGCSELEVLNLSGCNKVTDSATRTKALIYEYWQSLSVSGHPPKQSL